MTGKIYNGLEVPEAVPPAVLYQFLPADRTLERVAARYGTTADGIRQANVFTFRGRPGALTGEGVVNADNPAAALHAFKVLIDQGRSFLVPTPQMELATDWQVVSMVELNLTGPLATICNELTRYRPFRRGQPPVFAEDLWQSLMNAGVRRAAIAAAPTMVDAWDASPGDARIPLRAPRTPGGTPEPVLLYLPWREPAARGSVMVSNNGSSPAPVSAAWVQSYEQQLDYIASATTWLKSRNDEFVGFKNRCTETYYRLDFAKRLLTLLVRNALDVQRDSGPVQEVLNRIEPLRAALQAHLIEPFAEISAQSIDGRQVIRDRNDLAARLARLAQGQVPQDGGTILGATQWANTELRSWMRTVIARRADHADGAYLYNRTCLVYAAAQEELTVSGSHALDELLRELELEVPSDESSHPEPTTPLGELLHHIEEDRSELIAEMGEHAAEVAEVATGMYLAYRTAQATREFAPGIEATNENRMGRARRTIRAIARRNGLSNAATTELIELGTSRNRANLHEREERAAALLVGASYGPLVARGIGIFLALNTLHEGIDDNHPAQFMAGAFGMAEESAELLIHLTTELRGGEVAEFFEHVGQPLGAIGKVYALAQALSDTAEHRERLAAGSSQHESGTERALTVGSDVAGILAAGADLLSVIPAVSWLGPAAWALTAIAIGLAVVHDWPELSAGPAKRLLMATLRDADNPDFGRLATTFTDLRTKFNDLREAALAWSGSMQQFVEDPQHPHEASIGIGERVRSRLQFPARTPQRPDPVEELVLVVPDPYAEHSDAGV